MPDREKSHTVNAAKKGAKGPARVDEATSKIALHTADELRRMSLTEVISHTVRLQQIFSQLEVDNKFLAWEFQEYQDNLTYFSRAAKLAHLLNAADMESISNLAVNEVPHYFDCRFAALFFYDSDRRLLSLHASTNKITVPGSLHILDDAEHFLIKMFMHNEEPFIAEYDPENNVVVADNEFMPPTSVPRQWPDILGSQALVMPLWVKKADWQEPLVLGGLLLGDSTVELGTKAVEASVLFADLLSSSLYNAKLLQKLNELAIVEPLTQIYNRRHLLNQLNAAMIQAQRHGHMLSIAILDIDDFKLLNDTYGHVNGDEVLKTVGSIIKSSIRLNIDVPARYGGEEFIVVMPFIGLDNAAIVAERLRLSIKRHIFEFNGKKVSITCSVGVAEYQAGETMEQFINRADTALYRAKEDGKDTTCYHSPEAAL